MPGWSHEEEQWAKSNLPAGRQVGKRQKAIRQEVRAERNIIVYMNRIVWIILFLFILAADLVAIFCNYETWRYITKPLVVISLIAYFISRTFSIPSVLKKWILLALVFSLAGDIFLLFETDQPLFFLLGLSSFLIAHIFYIAFFQGVRVREKIRGNVILLLMVVVYYIALVTKLSPYLEEMKLPVSIYGVVISFM